MIELLIEIDQLEALLDHLAKQDRTPLLDVAFKTLQDAHDNAAEQYWTEVWTCAQ